MKTLRRYRMLSMAIAPLLCGTIFPFIEHPASAQETLPYRNSKLPVETRLKDLFARLTPEEKLSLLTGTGFTTPPIPRLGVPAMEMVDAGQGVRGGSGGTQGPATLFPSGITMASSWNPELIGQVGRAIGEETLNKGTGAEVLLGPDVNIHRSPLGGRNGESFSEDPYLSAKLAVGYIRGLQSSGAAACIKHFACNNEEVDRDYVNVRIGERALREIYLPSFEEGVKQAHVWTLMSSYNQVNGYHSSANKYLLTDVLKGDWKFDGLVMSDWGGVHETVGVVDAGNDLEMPGGAFLTKEKLSKALSEGKITQAKIDDAVRRILRTVLRVGLLNGTRTPDHSKVNSPAHQKVAFEAAAQGMVLLKNERNVLPLSRTKIKSIAVIGPRAEKWQMGAGGSPALSPFYSISPLDGIRKHAGEAIDIRYVKGANIDGPEGVPVPESAFGGEAGESGLHAEYFANDNLQGEPALKRTDRKIDFGWDDTPPIEGKKYHYSVRWTGGITAPKTGKYTLTLTADDGCRLFLDGKPLIDHWEPDSGYPHSATVDLVAGKRYNLRVEYFQAEGRAFIHMNWQLPGAVPFTEAVNAARQSDVAVVVLGSPDEGEGHDRPSMALPGAQDELVQAVVAANKNTIVVLNSGTPNRMNAWLARVPGLIQAWFPGEEGGNALGALLFGEVNPSGKLPDTLAVRREDYPDYGNFPGVKGQVNYTEGIYVGYRHFDKKKIAPVFPFGYGLSYTTFRYANVRLSNHRLPAGGQVIVRAEITNTGKRAGAEVVELYVHDPAPKIDKPIRELKGFQKVFLKPGETKTVQFSLEGRSLAYYDVAGKRWKADAGKYNIEIGASSRDIRLQTSLDLAGTFYQKP